MKEECKHIYGYYKEEEERGGLIDQGITQINGYTEVTWFKYCPKCGESVGFCGMVMSHDKYEWVLKDRHSKPRSDKPTEGNKEVTK